MKTCYIFGAAEGLPQKLKTEKDDLVIAADAGFKHLKKLDIAPDIIIGDFDSLGFIPEGKEIITHPERKDDTDTLLAIKIGFKRGYNCFVLYGCSGKRLDHTFANLQALTFVANNGGIAFLCGEDFTATVIENSSLHFCEKATGYISVFSVTTKCKGVTLKGLSYSIENTVLNSSFPLGVSNEFLNTDATVTVNKGSLLVIWQGSKDLIIED